MKYAMTADGRTATVTGRSKWITGEEARRHVHVLRNRYAAILAGINTVLADDPMLNCRIDGGRDPLRIICDSHLRIPMDSAVVRSSGKIPTIVVCSYDDHEKKEQLESMGIQVLCLPGDDGMVDLNALVRILGKRGVDSLFIEGGSRINYSALKSGIVNHVYCYVAPKIFGGCRAQVPVSGKGVDAPDDAFRLEICGMSRFGQDMLLEYEVKKCLQE